MKKKTKAEISVDIYNLYWYASKCKTNFKKFCRALKAYCKAKE